MEASIEIEYWPVIRKSNLLRLRMSNRFHYQFLYENGEVLTFLHNICAHRKTVKTAFRGIKLYDIYQEAAITRVKKK